MDDQEYGETRNCPLCAEPVKMAAVVCPHCQGRLQSGLLIGTYRNRTGRQIAGVAIALAEELGISVTFVRLVFVVLTFVNFLGPAIYVTMWLVLPAEPGGSSVLGRLCAAVPGDSGKGSIFERLLEEIRCLFRRVLDYFRSRKNETPNPPNEPGGAAEETP